MSIINLLASRNFIVVNKDVARKIGIEEAIMLGELASEYSYWQDRNELTEDGYFFSTIENVEKNTTFSQYKQQKTIERLQKEGLLYMSRRGIPAKRYIKLREDNILKLFGESRYTDEHDEQPKKQKVDYTEGFEEIWKKYPKKQGKENARKDYAKARKEGVSKEDIEAGLESYLVYIKARNTEEKYIKNGSTWFHQRCWEDVYDTNTVRNTGSKAGFHNMMERDWDFDELEKRASYL